MNAGADNQTVGAADTNIQSLEDLADLSQKSLLRGITNREEDTGFFVASPVLFLLHIKKESIMLDALLVQPENAGYSFGRRDPHVGIMIQP